MVEKKNTTGVIFFLTCSRWTCWRQIWRAPSGRFWRTWCWRECWTLWGSCCWSSTCTGPGSRWAGTTRPWCATGSACSRSWNEPTSASSTSTATQPNLTSSCTRTSWTPAVLTPWAGSTPSGGFEWRQDCYLYWNSESEQILLPYLDCLQSWNPCFYLSPDSSRGLRWPQPRRRAE